MKRLISLTTTFLCIFTIICVIGCKKKSDITPNNGGGETPTPVEADFFVDVDFLPKIETNGELAPRLMANYNDEVVMIELRPYTDTLIETVLFLCPDNKACMLCGNDTRLIYAEYDLETYTPSNDVILVTSKSDTAFLITKCIMDWSTNTMMTGDMMILPINNNTKNGKTKGHDEDIRVHFYNNFVIPLSKEFDKVQSFFGSWGSPAGSMIACINSIYSTAAPIILFSDAPELIVENMEYPTTMGIGQAAQVGILRLFPQNLSDMASRIISGLSWYLNGGSGEVNNYGGGSGGSNALSYANILCQANSVISVSTLADPEPMYSLSLNVSNITENSAYLRGNIYYNSGTTPAEMGYVYQVAGGPEYTEEDMGFHGKTINGLQKATKYTAYAYAKSIMGDRVISPVVSFWTLGFEAFPNSLTIPAEGDTKYVSLSYSEGDITGWEVTSNPSWCSITKDGDKIFAVTVGATTETRSGTIIVTGYSNALGSVTESVAVTQTGHGFFTGTPFENTSWNVPLSWERNKSYTTRNSEWNNTPTGGYYTYYTEDYTVNDSGDGMITPSFKSNELQLYGNAMIFEFRGDSIFLKYNDGTYEVVCGYCNNVAIDYSVYNGDIYDSGTEKYSRYFEDDNTFCLRQETQYISSYYVSSNWWHIENVEYDVLYVFKIINNDQCICNLYSTYNVSSQYGNEYIGVIQSNESTIYHGTGTYEHDVRNNTSFKGNKTSDFPLFPKIPIMNHQ